MSGIFALLQTRGGAADPGLVEHTTESLRYRGPDASGTWVEGEVGLGHALHVATDEARRERQPFARGGVVVTADARIDAREVLVPELIRAGFPLERDAPDVELIAAAYLAWGERCVERLLGDFAFALWDTRERKLFCAVDQLGVKPFYYAHRAGIFFGANSLHIARAHPDASDALDPIAVTDFVLFGGRQDRSTTTFRDVQRIDRGCYLVVQRGELRTQRYFDFPEAGEGRPVPEHECLETFEALLHKAVADRLRTPRAAVLMSGGIDSPLIAYRAHELSKARYDDAAMQAFTIVCDEHIPDEEAHFAGIAARAIGIPIDYQDTRGAESFDWTQHITSPQPCDMTMMWPLFAQRARIAASFPVLLTGWDGDALLRAETRLHWLERARRLQLRALLADLGWYVRHHGVPPIGARTAIARIRERFSGPAAPTRWLRPALRASTNADDRFERAIAVSTSLHPRKFAALDFRQPAWGELFDSHDPEFWRLPTESRHPLADLRVIRFALDLPAIPFCIHKQLLRRAARDLPAAIVTRPKAPMPGDPDWIQFQKSGLGSSARGWNVPELAEYVDCSAVEAALANRALPLDDFHQVLRSVALGLWLKGTRSARKP